MGDMSGHLVRHDSTTRGGLGRVWHVSGVGTEAGEVTELTRASRDVWIVVRASRIDLDSRESAGRTVVRSGGRMGREGAEMDDGLPRESKRRTGSKNSAAL